jgi:hypothetical protein
VIDRSGRPAGASSDPPVVLAASALDFDLDAELASLREEPSFQRGDRNGRTLVEETGFRVTLTALKARTLVSEHQAERLGKYPDDRSCG